jgi:hypothetical protein
MDKVWISVVLVTFKAITSVFAIISSVSIIAFLCKYRGYKRLLFQCILSLLVSTIICGVAYFSQTIIVLTSLVNDDEYPSDDDNASNAIDVILFFCNTTFSFIQYSYWVDVIIITAIVAWLVKITLKMKSALITNKKCRCFRYTFFVAAFLIPMINFSGPIYLAATNEKHETYFCLPQKNDTVPQYPSNLYALIGIWVGLTLLFLLADTIMLGLCVGIFIRRFIKGNVALKEQNRAVLIDGAILTLFSLIIFGLYTVQILSTIYYVLSKSQGRYSWFVESTVILIRGITIIIMFCNKRMREKIKLLPYAKQAQANKLNKDEEDYYYDSESEIRTPDNCRSSYALQESTSSVKKYLISN